MLTATTELSCYTQAMSFYGATFEGWNWVPSTSVCYSRSGTAAQTVNPTGAWLSYFKGSCNTYINGNGLFINRPCQDVAMINNACALRESNYYFVFPFFPSRR